MSPIDSSRKLVSVLIPAYNAAPWIAKTIETVLNQTWSDVEIIVVDDGSTDNTLEVAKSFETSNVRVISQKNSGASAARNRAFAESCGAYVQYLDADDLLAPDKIARQMKVIQSDPTMLCSGEWGAFFVDPREARFYGNELSRDLSSSEWLIVAWSNWLMMQPGAWLTPRELVLKAGPWNEELSLDDDGEFFARVITSASMVKFVPGARVFYRIGNTGSLSWSYSRKAHESIYKAVMSSVNCLLNQDTSDAAKAAVGEKISFMVYGFYPESRDLAQQAIVFLNSNGIEMPEPRGGALFQLLARVFGWRALKRIRQPYYVAKIRAIKRLREWQYG